MTYIPAALREASGATIESSQRVLFKGISQTFFEGHKAVQGQVKGQVKDRLRRRMKPSLVWLGGGGWGSFPSLACVLRIRPLKNEVLIFGAASIFPIIWSIWCPSVLFLAKSIII